MCSMTEVFNAISELREWEEWSRRAIDSEYDKADFECRQVDHEYIDDQILDPLEREEQDVICMIYTADTAIAENISLHYSHIN